MNADAVGLYGMVLRLLSATLVGGILGSNRELHGKAAGVRTHALVSLGAAIVTVVMLRQESEAQSLTRTRLDESFREF